jgi:site-specific DNA-methyltransferase (adenine-specific)
MVEIVTIGNATLYHGDCMDVIPTLPTVDAVFTSPPYNKRAMPDPRQGRTTTAWKSCKLGQGYGAHSDDLPWPEYEQWQGRCLALLWDRLGERGAIFYNHKPLSIDGVLWLPLRCNPGLPIRQIVIWDRGSGVNFSPSHFVPCHEWVIVFSKPPFRLKSRGASGIGDVWRIPPKPFPDHPAPFPVELVEQAIGNTPGQLWLDPFMGSGSVGVACANLGRKFIGIELERRFFDLACERIAAAQAQGRLFA